MHRSTELYESRKYFIESSRTSFLINALYDAVVDGDLGTVHFLLTLKKVDPNILLEDYDAAPLHTATGIGTEDLAVKLVQLLLDNNANPNIKTSDGTTPLMVSCLWGRSIVTNILLKYGADPWVEDSEGKNALDYASENGYYEMHEILKNTCVDVTITSDETIIDHLSPSKSFFVFPRPLIQEGPKSVKSVNDQSFEAPPSFNINCEIGEGDIAFVLENDSYEPLEQSNNAHNNIEVSSDETVRGHGSPNKTFNIFSKSHGERDNFVELEDSIGDALKDNTSREKQISGTGCLDTAFFGISNLQNSVSSTGTFCSFVSKDETEQISNEPPYKVSKVSDNGSSLSEPNSDSNNSVISYGTDRIRYELKKNHINHGPVTKTTKKVYQNLIKKIIKGNKKNFLQDRFSCYPEILQGSFKEGFRDIIIKWSNLEELMSKNFDIDKRTWRGGREKQFFTYLLLDPFITNDLPRKRFEMSEVEIWQTFVLSIFYVGKGKNSRPFSHLFEALKCNVKKTVSKKVLRIQKIWSSSAGIICLHLFHNIISAEAHTREAAMIDAIGLRNLTNIQSGEYYGVVKNWNIKQKQQLGIVLLKKALQIYLAEGERQIFPCDLT